MESPFVVVFFGFIFINDSNEKVLEWALQKPFFVKWQVA